ncbi:MAG: HEPN domain-containing protein [Ginsengibacter sp.]
MKCQADIQQLAEEKLKDAECLFENKKYNSAYYIAGYVIELLLKAKVCKNLGIDNLFDFENNKQNTWKADNNLNRSFKVHDYAQLLLLSGLYPYFEIENRDVKFKTHWSIICQWNEGARYLTGKTETDTKEFITSVKEIKQWIQNHL